MLSVAVDILWSLFVVKHELGVFMNFIWALPLDILYIGTPFGNCSRILEELFCVGWELLIDPLFTWMRLAPVDNFGLFLLVKGHRVCLLQFFLLLSLAIV